MRAIVCGGRQVRDKASIFRVLDLIHARRPISTVIEGGQRMFSGNEIIGGVDYWANQWAVANKIPVITEWADWEDMTPPVVIGLRNGHRYNKLAGPKRNKRMIDVHSPDALIAFPGGAGTKSMCDEAGRAGIEIIKVHH